MSHSFYRVSVLAMLISLAPLAPASDDRPDHFRGEPARTLEEALDNFTTYNARLAEIIAAERLDAQAVAEVHRLTYTLENALEKIEDELERLAELLEEVHVASERNDAETVQSRGRVYLESARAIWPE